MAKKKNYGAVRMSNKLKSENIKYRTGRLMKECGLKAKATKKFKVTTDSNHKKPVVPDLIQKAFNAETPNHKWVNE